MPKLRKGNYWGGGGFVALPREVIRSYSYAQLSPYAQKLMIDLLAQHNGKNNGDLCAAWSLMKSRGWRSKSTLVKAKRELLESGFLIMARYGAVNQPVLYALTFYRVDHCKGKLDIIDTTHPSDEWKKNEPRHPLLPAPKV